MKRQSLALSICLILSLTTSACSGFTSSKSTNSNSVASSNVEKSESNDNKSVVKVEDKSATEKKPEAKVEDKKEVKKDTNNVKSENKNNTTQKSTNNTSVGTKERDWFFVPKKDGSPSGAPDDVLSIINKNSAYYLGDTSEKVIYLTFDEGYENGYTGKILDILKANDVKAAFFVVVPYINSNKDLVKRMVNEGHLVCNHSNHHPSMAQVALKGKEAFNKELTDTEKVFEDLTGKKMPKYFRPPMGKYSELSLQYTKDLGYKTIFWSFAYNDWDPKKQPSHEYAKRMINERTHNGGIFLLHAVSKTNTEILDSVIKDLKAKGYRFASLDELK
ncbi:delta-lactam-biosynthetic de-N-acetylase [Clostridium lundense]|uniref:delta-lactam-biosynthetic de-N-acetylase n=1 Tax=Clostridium lundense TaxID=319475 RepID=UPI000A5B59E0|nr:delta-lactam-biosynthetic de-N-acetylase [Clostridium lundense]